MDIVNLALANLLNPPVLFFALGVVAALLRSNLTFPEAFGKALAVYLMLAIGFKGGASLRLAGLDPLLLQTLLAGLGLSLLLPVPAYLLLRNFAGLNRINAAAVAAHYGSVSVVTFVAAQQLLQQLDIPAEPFMVAVMALMETPAIISGLYLALRRRQMESATAYKSGELMRHIFFNGGVLVLLGAFVIGLIVDPKHHQTMAGFVVSPFIGVLCLFLLDMGVRVADRFLGHRHVLNKRLIACGIIMPLVGAAIGGAIGVAIGLSLGGAMLLASLAASASYIVVPAALRLALPDANPGLYVTMALGITFPFNIVVGLPLYLEWVRWLHG